MKEPSGLKIHINGVVQGVGFRPFVYGLATRFALNGWVKNTSAGVDIEVDGEKDVLDAFAKALRDEAPPLSRIDDFTVTPVIWAGFRSFDILHSQAVEGAFQPISPDFTICKDCLREVFDPADHRYRYPFINCTNCGPRFTIIKDIPYDRPKTTMATFPLCEICAKEYEDPLDRRFHAQPVACPDCGPHIWLESLNVEKLESSQDSLITHHSSDEAILEAQNLLLSGKILAIKGLGGFHLACDATNAKAVSELRERKLRVDKPFALMMPDIEMVEQHCFLNDAERELLESIARPIVLLRRRPESSIAKEVAPEQDMLGVMLPYTPLHYLLFDENAEFDALVMTSANLSEEPIAYTNEDARERLSSLADAFLMHNRDIHIRCDDSVVRVFEKEIYPLRRSRGYAPFPVKLPWDVPPLLAAGAELKNTFCITNQNYAFMSHHIGNLENYETLQSFEQGVTHFEKLFRVKPEAIAYDLHPNYLATRYAIERAESENLPTFGIQHHHAHIAAVMAENGLSGEEKVLGVAFDGTGYGEDGHIWGGEFLVADYAGYERAAHLPYFPLAGGDAATKRPSRTALGLLYELGIDWDEYISPMQNLCSEERMALRVQLEKKINTPMTSSMGRLFDAAAALAGGRQSVNYEAQGAIEFEALADDFIKPEFARQFYSRSNLAAKETAYPIGHTSARKDASRRVINRDNVEFGSYSFCNEQAQIELRSGILSLLKDVHDNIPISTISAKFHNGIAEMVIKTCVSLREKSGINTVALSGGVWQNMFLLERTLAALRADNFEVLIHRRVPANDGGLALGQAAIAAWQLK
ncbi:MAG: carbamoyltransferase HypF [Chloroflexi bacterium]|nr:carbamoyltransferase HypF [Chloroflexota bacterium]